MTVHDWIFFIIGLLMTLFLFIGFLHEDKLIRFEQDIAAIYRACRRQRISLQKLLHIAIKSARNKEE